MKLIRVLVASGGLGLEIDTNINYLTQGENPICLSTDPIDIPNAEIAVLDISLIGKFLSMDLSGLTHISFLFLSTNDELSIARIKADYNQDILITVGNTIKFAGSKSIILNNGTLGVSVYYAGPNGYSPFHISNLANNYLKATNILAANIQSNIYFQ
jgi:hypothetical protein